MKRSEINKALKDMHDLIKKFHVSLPPFCEWTPEEWKTKGKNTMKLEIICLAGI